MTSTTTGLITFTATATLGGLFATQLPSIAPKQQAAVANILNTHDDPTDVNPNDPIVLFIIQLAVIVGFSRFLSLFLAKIRQPRVIAEVIGGILLGPTAFGRIPGFTSHIFPHDSLSYLNLVATLGLILFLFLVGLEVDFALFKRNFRVAVAVATAGLAIPFGLGCAVSVGLYSEFIGSQIKFGNFMLFIGTSMSITAFPVLARILTELNLLGDKVGIIVLSAGVANDVIGWILLALTVALVNAGSGLVVLYVILCTVGWVLALFFLVRPVYAWLARRSGAFDGAGPNQSIVCLSLMICLGSAWVTEEIGVNAIFGGFMAGLIVPRNNDFPAHLAEKIEDLILSIFSKPAPSFPIYFATSGLKTNLGLLDRGIIWGWTICVIVVAFCGKFVGASTAAKWSGFSVRESCAIGSLMSAKGLVELIVLNVGLSAGVITPTVFSIFVLEAVLLTFLSTPLTLAFYPSHLRTPAVLLPTLPSSPPTATATPAPGTLQGGLAEDHKSTSSGPDGEGTKDDGGFLVVLDQIENLGAAMVFTQLVSALPHSPHTVTLPPNVVPTPAPPPVVPRTSLSILRLLDLSDRTSSLILASSSTPSLLAARDPLSNLFRTFCALLDRKLVTEAFHVGAKAGWAERVASDVREGRGGAVVLCWDLGGGKGDESGSLLTNPLETLFARHADPTPTYANLLRDIFARTPGEVSLFVTRRAPSLPDGASMGDGEPDSRSDHPSAESRSSPPFLAPPSDPSSEPGVATGTAAPYHLFHPFHGGPDDRACLTLLLRLVHSSQGGVTATVARIVQTAPAEPPSGEVSLGVPGAAGGDTVYPGGTAGRDGNDAVENETLDEVAWAQATAATGPGVVFETHTTPTPLATTLALSRVHGHALPSSKVVNLVGRGRWGGPRYRTELEGVLAQAGDGLGVVRSAEVRRGLGEVGSACVVRGGGVGVWVVQSGEVRGVRVGV